MLNISEFVTYVIGLFVTPIWLWVVVFGLLKSSMSLTLADLPKRRNGYQVE